MAARASHGDAGPDIVRGVVPEVVVVAGVVVVVAIVLVVGPGAGLRKRFSCDHVKVSGGGVRWGRAT